MNHRSSVPACLVAAAVLVAIPSLTAAFGQDLEEPAYSAQGSKRDTRIEHRREMRHRMTGHNREGRRASLHASAAPTYHGLTINKHFEGAPTPDIFGNESGLSGEDGDVAYGDIRRFDPVPYIDSGLQFPYGLDGIGGYGSDLGFEAGQDTAIYQRGP